ATVAAPTVFFLPGVAGFLVWEFNANFRLYAQNRADKLEPVQIGHHGETMSRLLRPGLHSGTVPKVFAKLRRAEHRGSPRAATHAEGLHEVALAVERFVARDVAALLSAAPAWKLGPVTVPRVDLAANRIRVALAVAGAPSCVVQFEEQSGRLLASVPE